MEITGNIEVDNYISRTKQREFILMTATIKLVNYFISLGDSQIVAEEKVTTLSTEISPYLYVYTLGNNNPLFNAINASTLNFMNEAAKVKIINDLTYAS